MNWSFQPIMNSYWAVALLAAGLVLALRVGPTFRKLSVPRRRTLLVLRCLVVLLVIVVMLRPTHISTQSKSQTAVLIVLFDRSRSMQLPNTSGGEPRWKAQCKSLRSIAPLLRDLGDDLEVKVYPYDANLGDLAWLSKELHLPREADGRQTDIGTSLHEALDKERGKRLAGVILLGDGTQTAFLPDVEIYEAARELGNRGHPLYTVSYGPSGDAAQSRDVAVENLPEQYTVFVKNELVVRGLIRVRGYVNTEIPLHLSVVDDAGNEQVVGPVTVQADKDNQQLAVNLSFIPQTPGQYRLTLKADDLPGELVTKNNQLTAFLTVLEGGLRVLYLEGEPRQEQKFIRWALDASPDIDLEFQWFPSRLRKDWPIYLGDTLEKGNYDVYILGDCDSLALGEANLKQLADEVERGKGLIAIGGYHSFGPGGYRNSALADLLPIEMDRLARQEYGRPEVDSWHVAGPLQMIPVRPHPVTALAPLTENEQVWRELKPLKGANRWVGIKEIPGIQLLAGTAEGVPLLVAGEYGGGRVLAFAADTTWQWWRQGLKTNHKRFWRQIVLWLARRDDLTRNDVWIDLAQRRFPIGSRVQFTAGARTAMGDVIPGASLSATLVDAQNGSTPVRLTETGDDFSGTIDPIVKPGSYRIDIAARDGSGLALGSATAHFEVMDQDVELSNPAADPDQMARLANFTRDAGGRVVADEELTDLLEEIKRNPPKLVEEVLTKWQLADTWLDAWIVLTMLTLLLTAEWFLRKQWGLV